MLRIIAVLLVLSTLLPASDEGALKGVVSDFQGVAVPHAYILVHRSHPPAEDTQVRPEKDGSFEVKLPPGVYDVFVTGVSFAPTCKKVEIRSGKVTVYSVRLRTSTLGATD